MTPRGRAVYEPLSFVQALGAGFTATLGASTEVVRTVRAMLTGRVSGRNVGGPIAIGQMAAASAQAGVDIFLGFLGLISINLAVLNLLPIPVLDGGQFVFLLAEGVLRRPLLAQAAGAADHGGVGADPGTDGLRLFQRHPARAGVLT